MESRTLSRKCIVEKTKYFQSLFYHGWADAKTNVVTIGVNCGVECVLFYQTNTYRRPWSSSDWWRNLGNWPITLRTSILKKNSEVVGC